MFGGIEAIHGSWPAQVFVSQTVNIKELNLTVKGPCGGTLINRRTVLYAAHCLTRQARINNVTYPITLNEEFPTLESTIKVYIGTHNRESAEAKVVSVSKVITVGHSFNRF